MSFYDRFVALCKLKGVTKSKALEEMGFAKSLAIKWKNNPAASPHANTISVIADYFGVPIVKLDKFNSNPGNKKPRILCVFHLFSWIRLSFLNSPLKRFYSTNCLRYCLRFLTGLC